MQIGRRVVTRFPTGKSLQLLAFLALHPGIKHGRVFLADLLWPDVPPNIGRPRLSVALTFLRSLLEGANAPGMVFDADRLTIRLLPNRIQTDVGDFEKAIQVAYREAARPGATAAKRLHLLGNALRTYGGELLPGVTDEWVESERARLSSLQDGLLDAWQSLTRRHPPKKRSHPHRLDHEGPSLPIPGLATAFEPSKAVLPQRLTRLIGRDTEVQSLRRLSREDTRLVTLTGLGGVGKTQLALEAAAGETHRPVVWVPLAELTDSGDIITAVAEALRLPLGDTDAIRNSVVHALNVIPALVLLDNAEHLRAGVADVVMDLIATAPKANFWVTSRESLDVYGEQIFPVGPLSLPPDGAVDLSQVEASFACALFADHARRLRPDFVITVRNAALVARLCRRLDGLPLALELAAARVQTTSLGMILQSLQGGSPSRFSSSRRGLPLRHQSLYTALAWSVRLLLPQVAHFFFLLSIFHGGWTVEAAEYITSNPLAGDYLAELVSVSLVVAIEQGESTMRYYLLETVRDFADGELDDVARATVRERHRAYYLDLAERYYDRAWECGQEFRPEPIAEEDNLLAALETARHEDSTVYLRLAGAATLWLHRRQGAATTHLQQALALSPAVDSVYRARALFSLMGCHVANGTLGSSPDALHEAIAMARRLNALRTLARYLVGDVDNAQALDEAVRLTQAHGTVGEQAQTVLGQAVATWRLGKPDAAEAQFVEAHRLSQVAGVSLWPSLATEWGYFLLWRGDLQRAVILEQTAVEALALIDERYSDHARWILASALVGIGRYAEAREHADRVIESRRLLQPSLGTVTPRRIAAVACFGQSDLKAAESYLEQATSILISIDFLRGAAQIGPVQAELALACGDGERALACAEAAYAVLHGEIGHPDLPTALFWESANAVNARSALARAEAAMQLWDAARRGFSDTLRFRHRYGLYNGACLEIEGLAAWRAESGDAPNAARLFAACETLRLRGGIPPFPHQVRELAARTSLLRSDPALRAMWKEGQKLSLIEAVCLALSE